MSRGSNLRAMAQSFVRDALPVQIAFCVVTRRDAPVNEVCREFDIPCHYLPYKKTSVGAISNPPYSETFEDVLHALIHSLQIDLIALAGFLKLLSASFINNCAIPILNIHPALLPRYGGKGMYGAAVHQAVYENGDKVSGATVHLVNEHYDQGTILAREEVDISDCHSPSEIAGRVLAVEHRIYAQAIWQVLTNKMSGSESTHTI